jgi:hypothetical protein
VVMVNAPDVFFMYCIASGRVSAGRVSPEKMLVLASGRRSMEIERRDATTLVVRPEEGFFRAGTELLTRSATSAMPVGSRVALTGVTIDVTRAGDDGVPTEAAFHFATPLEDEHLAWVEWQGRGFVPFVLPRVGETRHIEAQVPSL